MAIETNPIAADERRNDLPQRAGFRGFFFNPQVDPNETSPAWLRHYHIHKDIVDRELRELVAKNYDNIEINIHPDSIYMGALGAALYAWEAIC